MRIEPKDYPLKTFDGPCLYSRDGMQSIARFQDNETAAQVCALLNRHGLAERHDLVLRHASMAFDLGSELDGRLGISAPYGERADGSARELPDCG